MAISFFPERKTYYYRSHIPESLRLWLKNRREVWRSLDTLDKDVAKIRAAQWDSRTLQLYRTLRRHGERMTEDQREALVSQWLDAELEYAEDCRATAGRWSQSQVEGNLEGLSIMQDEALEDIDDNDYRRVERVADDLLKTAGLSLEHASADFGRLCRKLLEAKYEYTRIETRRWQGEPYHPLIERTQPVNGSHAPVAVSPASSVKTTSTGPLFMEVVDGYLRESPRTDRSTRALKAELLRFVAAIGGDRAVNLITKSDCLKYKDSLLKEDERGLHLATVSDRLTTLAGIFKWCEAQGYIPENTNPAKNLAPSAKAVRKATKPRKLFTDEQLVMIYGSAKFKSLRTEHPAHYWVLCLCLWTIARREENSQLLVDDIREEDGIPYILITEEGGGDKSVKTKTSRRIPLHSSLLTLGFLQYVQTVKEAGHVRLFHQFQKGKSTYADAAGKMFSRIVRGLGMTDTRLVLHGLRHLGITKLAEAGCPPDISRVLTGHSGRDVHDTVYVHGDRFKLSALRDGLNKLRYDDVLKALKS